MFPWLPCGRQKKTHEASLVPAAPEDVGPSLQGIHCLENSSKTRCPMQNRKAPQSDRKQIQTFPVGAAFTNKWLGMLHMPEKKVEKTVSTIWVQPSSNPRIGLTRGIHADSLHTGHLPCLAGSKSLSKDSIHKLLGPTHHFTHTQVGHTAKKKNMLRYLSASIEACSSPPVATPVCLTNQRRQLWNYRF